MDRRWLGLSIMIAGLVLAAGKATIGATSLWPFIIAATVFLPLSGFGVWVAKKDPRIVPVMGLWLRIGWRKPFYDPAKQKRFTLRFEAEKN
jgi:hypothetical protein